MKTSIIYWSSTGNTEKIAFALEEALDEAITLSVDQATQKDLEADLICLGSPAMGVEHIDDTQMEPFLLRNKDVFKGKAVALFGSYDWGDGTWMDEWSDMMEAMGAKLKGTLKIQNEPDASNKEQIVSFASSLKGA